MNKVVDSKTRIQKLKDLDKELQRILQVAELNFSRNDYEGEDEDATDFDLDVQEALWDIQNQARVRMNQLKQKYKSNIN